MDKVRGALLERLQNRWAYLKKNVQVKCMLECYLGHLIDQSIDTMHLKDPLVLFGSEGSAVTFYFISSFV